MCSEQLQGWPLEQLGNYVLGAASAFSVVASLALLTASCSAGLDASPGFDTSCSIKLGNKSILGQPIELSHAKIMQPIFCLMRK